MSWDSNNVENIEEKINKGKKIALKLGLVAMVGVIGLNSLTIIETGNVGVKSTLGQIQKEELEPGLNFALPFVQKIEPVFTKTIMINYSGSEVANDTEELYQEGTLSGEDESGLEMGIDMVVEVNPQMDKMADMFIDVGRQGFEKKTLQPIRGVARKVLGQFKAELIMQQRKEVEEGLRKELIAQFAKNPYFTLENVQLKKIYLPPKVKDAIERVALAKQEAKAKKEQIVANENLAQSQVALAKGEAEAKEARAAGQANAMVIEAKAKAEVIELQASAQAEANANKMLVEAKAAAEVIELKALAQAKANKMISESLSADLIQQNSIEAWRSGGAKVPNIVSDDSQFLYSVQADRESNNK